MNFGSGDSDQLTYDANTGRMTKYKFTVNSQTLEGDLSWNALGTLGSLGITDPFNSSQDTQTCGYTHDDLGRIATDTCAGGVGWTQNFSYDAFGNISKSGSGAFAPNYTSSPPTNQISTVGSTAAHYDANGNVLTDTVQSYAWDADGHPVSIGNVGSTSVGAAYDALGDVVEQNRSGAFTQVVYAPDGTKLALMSGTSTMVKAFVPLTGGATAIYNSTGLAYYRHADWLGSSRLTTTASRTVYSDAAYAPFGETYAAMGTPDASFTGMNQDTVPTVDDFPAREYGSLSGRWASPDPLGVGAVDPTDPQSWNRYAYVRNSPLGLTDPDGTTYFVCFDGYDTIDAQYGCGFIPGDSLDSLNSYISQFPGELKAWDNGMIVSTEYLSWVGTYSYYGPDVIGDNSTTVHTDAPQMQTIEIDPGQLTDPGAQPGTSPGGGSGAAAGAAATNKGMVKCNGSARVLQGNAATIGKPGGFSGPSVGNILITSNGASIIPSQWGPGKAFLRPYLSQISGVFPGVNYSFQGVVEVMGGAPPPGFPANSNVQTDMMQLNPGKLILELPGAPRDFGTTAVTITTPSAVGCPAGTEQVP